MTRSFRDVLDERAVSLVGRDRELSELLRLVDDDRPLVAVVHGLAGVGKSTLLRAVAARARGQGASVVQLDGATVEPTPRGFLGALASVVGEPMASVEEAGGRLAADSRVLLVVDTLERLRLLEDWLWQALVPALPENARLLLAGRDPLGPAWATALGELLSSIALPNLAAVDARQLLRSAGVAERDLDRVNRLAHGHPLSLRLARPGRERCAAMSMSGRSTVSCMGSLRGSIWALARKWRPWIGSLSKKLSQYLGGRA